MRCPTLLLFGAIAFALLLLADADEQLSCGASGEVVRNTQTNGTLSVDGGSASLISTRWNCTFQISGASARLWNVYVDGDPGES